MENYDEWLKKNQSLLDQFVRCNSVLEAKELLRIHGSPICTEHGQSYVMLGCLKASMRGDEETATRMARCAETLAQLHDLAVNCNMPVMSRNVIGRFFETYERKPEARDCFQQGMDVFMQRVQDRAAVKLKEEMDEEEKQQKTDKHMLVDVMRDMPLEERMAPGGLDPVEVFDSLPPALQECFKTGSNEMMQRAAVEVPDFEQLLKRCEDAGLWRRGEKNAVPEDDKEEG